MHRHGRVQRGRGMAFARYKNLTAYCAIVMEASETRGEVKIHKVVSSVYTGTVTTAFTTLALWLAEGREGQKGPIPASDMTASH